MKTALLAAVILLVVALANSDGDAQAGTSHHIDAQEAEFLALLNDYRAANGVTPLYLEYDISEAADWMSADMGAKGYFSHTSADGRSPWQRMCDFGYCYNTYRGENIAAGYNSAAAVFAAWKASPGHNTNMLNPNYRAIGIGRVYVAGSIYGYYWTTDFGGVVTRPCPLDLNGDEVLTSLDLIGYASGLNVTIRDPGYWRYLDLNRSDSVNTLDLVPYASRINTLC